MMLESDGQAVGRGAREAGGRDEAGEGRRAGLEGGEHESGFVEDPDSARVVHVLILPYRNVRRNRLSEET